VPHLRQFFYTVNDHVFCEREIVDSRGDTKRIDRMIVRAGAVDIIDFKSSREEEESHVRQVKSYLKVAAELYASKNVRGWLIYLNDRSVQEVAG